MNDDRHDGVELRPGSSPEPREAALSQVERDTAGQQKRVQKVAAREAKAKETKALKDDLAAPPEDRGKVARDTARYEALAREHGADLSEEGFNEAVRKVARSPS